MRRIIEFYQDKGGRIVFASFILSWLLAIHSLLPDFKDCGIYPTTFPDDPHFNEAGHRVDGEAIARYLI